jgi:hypothetical protein
LKADRSAITTTASMTRPAPGTPAMSSTETKGPATSSGELQGMTRIITVTEPM